jgi:hypothetical protein
MEILIIGGIIVALMIYTSTRIKRNAAEAFQEEAVETDDFSLTKPEGFLAPVETQDFLAFYAYSKDYGEEGKAEKSRQGLIKLKVLAGRSLAEIAKDIKSKFDETLREEKTDADTIRLTGSRTENEVETLYYHKLIAQGERIFDLEMAVLGEYRELYEERAEKLLESFRVK